jgi:hypothetical protein
VQRADVTNKQGVWPWLETDKKAGLKLAFLYLLPTTARRLAYSSHRHAAQTHINKTNYSKRLKQSTSISEIPTNHFTCK